MRTRLELLELKKKYLDSLSFLVSNRGWEHPDVKQIEEKIELLNWVLDGKEDRKRKK
jgi:hypothetical protein